MLWEFFRGGTTKYLAWDLDGYWLRVGHPHKFLADDRVRDAGANVLVMDGVDSLLKVQHDELWEVPLRIARPSGASGRTQGLVFEMAVPGPPAEAVLRTLVEVAVASIMLARLGIPRKAGTVVVQTTGPLPAACVPVLEQILYMFMWSRGRRAGQPPQDVDIIVQPAADAEPISAGTLQHRSAVLGLSGGMDSTACLRHLLTSGQQVRSVFYEYYLSPDGSPKGEIAQEQVAVEAVRRRLGGSSAAAWQHAHRTANLSPLLRIPFHTFVDDIDNDPWEFYGRNFITATLLVGEAIAHDAQQVVLGATAEDLFATEELGTEEMYSECCQSVAFLAYFNRLLDALFDGPHPVLVAPLLRMQKGNIVRYLAQDVPLLAKTRSCIGDGSVEDGTCFSCFDKLTGILAVLPPEGLDVRSEDRVLTFLSGDTEVARFRWRSAHPLGNSNECYTFSEVCAIQLRRYLAGYPDVKSRLQHSKFHYVNILAMLQNLQGRSNVLDLLFPSRRDQELVAQAYATVDERRLGDMVEPWLKLKPPLNAEEFAQELSRSVDWQLVPWRKR